mmetsp:Transcript_57343/g.102494  ORF Transcript_57343/g.102494 Transcript_57343/m.102494 type:complete len:307 (+) Transcript_57343:461-1381(+)
MASQRVSFAPSCPTSPFKAPAVGFPERVPHTHTHKRNLPPRAIASHATTQTFMPQPLENNSRMLSLAPHCLLLRRRDIRQHARALGARPSRNETGERGQRWPQGSGQWTCHPGPICRVPRVVGAMVRGGNQAKVGLVWGLVCVRKDVANPWLTGVPPRTEGTRMRPRAASLGIRSRHRLSRFSGFVATGPAKPHECPRNGHLRGKRGPLSLACLPSTKRTLSRTTRCTAHPLGTHSSRHLPLGNPPATQQSYLWGGYATYGTDTRELRDTGTPCAERSQDLSGLKQDPWDTGSRVALTLSYQSPQG